MPSTRRCGVVSTLPKVSLPLVSSNTAMSVKVPPMSAARRRPEGVRVSLILLVHASTRRVGKGGPAFVYCTKPAPQCPRVRRLRVGTAGYDPRQSADVSAAFAHPTEDVDGRDIGERSDAVLRTAMPGHDGLRRIQWRKAAPCSIGGKSPPASLRAKRSNLRRESCASGGGLLRFARNDIGAI